MSLCSQLVALRLSSRPLSSTRTRRGAGTTRQAAAVLPSVSPSSVVVLSRGPECLRASRPGCLAGTPSRRTRGAYSHVLQITDRGRILMVSEYASPNSSASLAGFSFPFRSGCHDMIMGQEEFLLAFDARLLHFLESPPLWLGIYWNKPVPSLRPLQGACTTRYLANNHARGQSQEEGQPKV